MADHQISLFLPHLWQISMPTGDPRAGCRIRTDFLWTPPRTTKNSLLGAAVQRPNINPGVIQKKSGSLYGRVNGYNNPNAFTAVNEFRFGDEPKPDTALRGPGSDADNWDPTLIKMLAIDERVNIAFRVDIQNVFNHPWFAPPNTTLGSSTFGQITSDCNAPQQIQIGGRISF